MRISETPTTLRPSTACRAEVLSSPADIDAARRLQAERYVAYGYVDRLSAAGVIDDPWASSAVYFGVRADDGRFVGVSRLIPAASCEQLPVAGAFEFNNPWADRLRAFEPSLVAEPSALTVCPTAWGSDGLGTVDALMGAMSTYSLAFGQRFWVAAIDARVLRMLRRRHGFRFETIGASRDYLGSLTVPVVLDLHDQVRAYDRQEPDKNEHFLTGLEIDLTGEHVTIRPRCDLEEAGALSDDSSAALSI